MADSLPEHDRILQEIESTDTACVGPTLRKAKAKKKHAPVRQSDIIRGINRESKSKKVVQARLFSLSLIKISKKI